MNVKLVLRVEWNETVYTSRNLFDRKKFSNLSLEILVEWIAPCFITHKTVFITNKSSFHN